jgi:hypothetical protein
MEFTASDGTEEGTVKYDFTQYDSSLYKDKIPSQSQHIPDYFDLSWSNTRGYVSNYYNVEDNVSQ